eukprot:525844-Pleurochrysis_carterae.AAC.1
MQDAEFFECRQQAAHTQAALRKPSPSEPSDPPQLGRADDKGHTRVQKHACSLVLEKHACSLVLEKHACSTAQEARAQKVAFHIKDSASKLQSPAAPSWCGWRARAIGRRPCA